MKNNEWLVSNLMKSLRPFRERAESIKNEIGTCGEWIGQGKITTEEWLYFGEAANRMVRDYKEKPDES